MDRFLRANHLEPSDDPDPMSSVPEEYGWHILPTNETYERQSDPVRIAVSVDRSGARPVVYVFSGYYW